MNGDKIPIRLISADKVCRVSKDFDLFFSLFFSATTVCGGSNRPLGSRLATGPRGPGTAF